MVATNQIVIKQCCGLNRLNNFNICFITGRCVRRCCLRRDFSNKQNIIISPFLQDDISVHRVPKGIYFILQSLHGYIYFLYFPYSSKKVPNLNIYLILSPALISHLDFTEAIQVNCNYRDSVFLCSSLQSKN